MFPRGPRKRLDTPIDELDLCCLWRTVSISLGAYCSFTNMVLSMFLVMIWWVISAHKWFKGPKINVRVFSRALFRLKMLITLQVEHHMIGRVENTVEGIEQDSGSDDPTYPKAKEAGISETTPELKA